MTTLSARLTLLCGDERVGAWHTDFSAAAELPEGIGFPMLHRQALLLATLHVSRRRLSKLDLMKLLFLTRQEWLGGGSAVYDFVPCKHGPFSFSVHRDLFDMAQRGLLFEEGRVISSSREWTEMAFRSLSHTEQAAVSSTGRKYGDMSARRLLDYVYSSYPWFASRSGLTRKQGRLPREQSGSVLYTAGYEGETIDGFLCRLMQSDIEAVLDVRQNPVSRKYGFSKSTLQRLAANVGVKYFHFKELGIPSADRKNLRSADDYARLFARYESSMLPRADAAVRAADQIVIGQRSALVCFERNHKYCHRSHLADRMARDTGLSVLHL